MRNDRSLEFLNQLGEEREDDSSQTDRDVILSMELES